MVYLATSAGYLNGPQNYVIPSAGRYMLMALPAWFSFGQWIASWKAAAFVTLTAGMMLEAVLLIYDMAGGFVN
jgi:hypothetical protein